MKEKLLILNDIIRKKLRNRFTIFRRLPLLLSLTRRGFLFFAFLLVAQVLLFFTGNVQHFLDENLQFILIICCFTSIGMALFSLAAAIECIYYAVSTKKMFFYVHLTIFILFFIGAVIICLATNSVVILTQGITS